MKRKMKTRSRKALSPVVASIILIAVTVAVSIAVAAWMGALSFNFMNTEQITFTNYQWGTNDAYFLFTVKNTGSTDLTIQEARIDGVAPSDHNCTTAGVPGVALTKGLSTTINVTRSSAFTSGVQYEFTVITSKGNTFGPYVKSAP
jgi:flagellin-like protein